MTWESAKIGDLLAKVKRPGKLQKTEYQESGAFPVIDQGASYIAGFSDNPDIVLRSPLPITVFGDHTRRVKLAHEPFICGADGTQLLYPKREDIDPVFFYYAVKNVDLSNYFYARHFKFLKDQEIFFPDLFSQKRIAEILSEYDGLIENNLQRVALLERSARLLYREWFVHLRFPGHERVRTIDGLLEGWTKTTIEQHCPLIYGKALKADAREPGEVDVYGSSGVVGSHNKALVNGPAIIVGRKGNVGSIFWARRDFWPIDTVYYVAPENCDFFTYYALQHVQFINTDVAVPGLNRDFAHSRKLIIPPEHLLEGFHAQIEPIQAKIGVLERQAAELAKARDLLLPRLMDGRVEV